jgi:hypothetical protein
LRRFVSVASFNYVETGVTVHFRGVHSQQKVILDDQNDGPLGR